MKFTIKDRVILISYYLLLAFGLLMILKEVLVKFEHGDALVGIVFALFLVLWVKVRFILESKAAAEFREKHNSICKSCRYRKENDKL